LLLLCIGIENKTICPEPLNNVNVYNMTPTERAARNVAELPGSLKEALAILDTDEVIKDALDQSSMRPS